MKVQFNMVTMKDGKIHVEEKKELSEMLSQSMANFEYNLIWNGEVIDTASTKKEALTLKLEYELAFNSSNVMIKRVRAE